LATERKVKWLSSGIKPIKHESQLELQTLDLAKRQANMTTCKTS